MCFILQKVKYIWSISSYFLQYEENGKNINLLKGNLTPENIGCQGSGFAVLVFVFPVEHIK